MSNSKIQTEITLGALFIIIASVLLVFLGFRENDKLVSSEVLQQAEAIEVGASLFATNCAPCHGDHGEGRIGPPFKDPHFFDTSPDGRLKEVGWESTLEDYIVSVASAGRPVSTRPEQWPGNGGPGYAMPSWSQEYGGPLRPDQIRDIAAFIINWEAEAVSGVSVTIVAEPLPLSDDPIARGQAIFTQQGCAACHAIEGISVGAVGPELTHVATVAQTRIDGYTAEEYIRESILDPNAYVVEGFNNGMMPPDFSDKIPEDQLVDLLAFLLSQE